MSNHLSKDKQLAQSSNKLVVFEDKKIRRVFHEGEWYFSIVDIVEVLTGSSNSRRYWSDLKIQLVENEGYIQLYGKIVQLKLTSSDGCEPLFEESVDAEDWIQRMQDAVQRLDLIVFVPIEKRIPVPVSEDLKLRLSVPWKTSGDDPGRFFRNIRQNRSSGSHWQPRE